MIILFLFIVSYLYCIFIIAELKFSINRNLWKDMMKETYLSTRCWLLPISLKYNIYHHTIRDDRIKVHFLTCFISLIIYRILEKQLDNAFTCEKIINILRKMDIREVSEHVYIPNYKRTEITDALHNNAGFRTDNELTTPKSIAGILRPSKGL